MSTNTQNGINVGCAPETVREIGYVIMDIIKFENTDDVKLAALDTLRYSTKIDNASISNNVVRFETVRHPFFWRWGKD